VRALGIGRQNHPRSQDLRDLEFGIVPSLARPGGNITGVSVDVGDAQRGKRFQLLNQMVP
jgi:hypothetical protein